MTLTQRLRDGKGADRELDADIHEWAMRCETGIVAGQWRTICPAYTSDLNAVFALVERELPDRCLDLRKGYGYTATVYCVGDDTVSAWKHSDACRALLLALIASTQKE
jgi:hypothetical protein